MRAVLNGLYGAAGALAAVFLMAIAVLIVAQIVARLMGYFVPAAADFAGFCLAASSFLALAHTFRAGTHIRVVLLLQRFPVRSRRGFDLAGIGVGFLLAAYFGWHAFALAYDSWRFNDLSDGLVAVPLWLPQCGMALGLVVLAIALADEFVNVLRGRTPTFDASTDVVLGAGADGEQE